YRTLSHSGRLPGRPRGNRDSYDGLKFRLEPSPASEAFISNLRRRPVFVFVRGSKLAGYEMRVRHDRVCVASYNRIHETAVLGVIGSEPSLPEVLVWAFAVFREHGVVPEPPIRLPEDPVQPTWDDSLRLYQRLYPTRYDPRIVRQALIDRNQRIPEALEEEIRGLKQTVPDAPGKPTPTK
ncbi:hypothetical protein L6V77_35495, partial [Myxococcota bacterium]|nr:hypothetical protein [Myxococcota bacterium]